MSKTKVSKVKKTRKFRKKGGMDGDNSEAPKLSVEELRAKRIAKFQPKDEDEDGFSEDSQGWHIHSEDGCIGCESGVDNSSAHCTACNQARGLASRRHDSDGYYESQQGGRRKNKRKSIKINPKMKGVFTRKAKSHGMSVQKYAAYIIKKYKGKCKTKNELKLLRQAVFAKSSKKFKRKKSRKRKQKGGYCNEHFRAKRGRYRGLGTCGNPQRNGRYACCDARPTDRGGEGNMCHFIEPLRDEYAERIKQRPGDWRYAQQGPLYVQMDREHKAYHALENSDPSKFFEPVLDASGRTIRYDKTKYKRNIAEEDIPTMQRIERLRNQWYERWYREDCITCDGNCTNHSARGAYAHQAHVDARGRVQEGKERAAAAAAAATAATAVEKFNARLAAKTAVEDALDEKNYEKATEALKNLQTTCKAVEFGGGCQEDYFVKLENRVRSLGQSQKAPAEEEAEQKPAAEVSKTEPMQWADYPSDSSDDGEDTGAGGGNKRKSKRRKRSMKKTHKRKSRKNKKR